MSEMGDIEIQAPSSGGFTDKQTDGEQTARSEEKPETSRPEPGENDPADGSGARDAERAETNADTHDPASDVAAEPGETGPASEEQNSSGMEPDSAETTPAVESDAAESQAEVEPDSVQAEPGENDPAEPSDDPQITEPADLAKADELEDPGQLEESNESPEPDEAPEPEESDRTEEPEEQDTHDETAAEAMEEPEAEEPGADSVEDTDGELPETGLPDLDGQGRRADGQPPDQEVPEKEGGGPTGIGDTARRDLTEESEPAWEQPSVLSSDVQSADQNVGHGGNVPEAADDLIPGQTGGSERPRFDGSVRSFEQAEKWANDAYDVIRGSDDVADIADNLRHAPRVDGHTGFTSEEIQAVKNHLFVDEHPLEGSNGGIVNSRFDPSPDIAEAWLRLRSDGYMPQDLTLLEHELAEHDYWRRHPGVSYPEAHRAANSVANWENDIPASTYEDYGKPWK
jgi:hypothetical protein